MSACEFRPAVEGGGGLGVAPEEVAAVVQDGADEEDAPALLDFEGHVDGGEEGVGVDAADVRFGAAELGRVRCVGHDREAGACGEVCLKLCGVPVVDLATGDGCG